MLKLIDKFEPIDIILILVIILTGLLVALGLDAEIKTIFKASVGVGIFKKFLLDKKQL